MTSDRTINDITLSELMGEDLDISMCKEKFGFDLFINNYDGTLSLHEKSVHPMAAESFADFCTNYLTAYYCAKRQAA